MNEETLKVLETSKEKKELVAAVLSLARSSRKEDHDELLKRLKREDFLSRLDTEEDYANTGRRLRIGRVLEALSQNKAPSAHAALAALTQDTTFVKEAPRADLLIEACAVVRPAPPEVVRFWDNHSQPDDGFSHLTIKALVDNGSAPALALLEKKMADGRHEEEDKTGWMRSSILTHRNDLLLLQSCERMLAGGLPANLRPVLVEALFDYQPAEWYSPAATYNPPDRRQASPEALAQLEKIGRLALKSVPLSARLKEVVEKTLEDIEKKR